MADENRFRERAQFVETGSPSCLNCGARLAGAFCASCGQRDIPPYPTVRELVIDAVSEFSGWDGRLASTLRELIHHPGALTHEFLEGRRVRYISPLRLYLVASLVYFLVAAASPNTRIRPGELVALPGVRIGTTPAKKGTAPVSRPERVANAANEALETGVALSAKEREEALKDIERAPPLMQPFLRRAIADPAGFRRGMLEMMPKMLFALLPLFAGILALFYRGRKYPEHLYFAIHLHAFIFLALTASELVKFTRVPVLVVIASFLAAVSIPIYGTLSLRRVYGGSVAATLIKEVGIALIYAIAAGIGLMVVIFWVSLAR